MLKAFATWLAGEAGLALGSTLYAGHRPAEAPDACTAIYERGGERAFDETPAIREKAIQLVTRATSYFTARDEAHRIFDLLIGRIGVQLPGFYIYSITGNAPQFLSQGEKGRFEFSTNLLIRAKKEG